MRVHARPCPRRGLGSSARRGAYGLASGRRPTCAVLAAAVDLLGRTAAATTRPDATPLTAWATDGTVTLTGAVKRLPCKS